MRYITRDDCPDLRFFICPRYSAMLSDKACAERYVKARAGSDDGPMYLCRGCALGAEHSGVNHRPVDVLGHLCVRCHNHAPRLLRGAICISCYNREREFLIGRNGKGQAPRPINRFWALWPKENKGAMVSLINVPVATTLEKCVVVKVSNGPEAWLTVFRSGTDKGVRWRHRTGANGSRQMSLFELGVV